MTARWRRIFHRIIPSIIAGGADNDPAGIATYSISGARFGYQQLWLLILSTPMLIAVQAMCARLGDINRKGLMLIIKEHYAPSVAYASAAILIVTNTTTLGADLAGVAEAVGMKGGGTPPKLEERRGVCFGGMKPLDGKIPRLKR